MGTEKTSSVASLEQARKLKSMEENKALYGNLIRERRKAFGMKQEDLANLVGVKTISVTQWEAGRTRPDVGNIPQLCKALKITPNDFFLGKVSKSGLRPDEEDLLLMYNALPERDRILLRSFATTMADKIAGEMRAHCINDFDRVELSLNYAAAGASTALGDDESEMVFIRKSAIPRHTDLIITVSGRSMEPDFKWGDQVFVELTESLSFGEIGIFIHEDVGYIKQYFKGLLHSLNPDEDDIRVLPDDNFRIIGRVLGKVPQDAYPDKEEQAVLDEIERERLS